MRSRPDRDPELVVAGAGLVGLAFGPRGEMVVASNDSVYSFPPPHDRSSSSASARAGGGVAGPAHDLACWSRACIRWCVSPCRVVIGTLLIGATLQICESYRVHDLGLGLLLSLSPVGVFDLAKWWFISRRD